MQSPGHTEAFWLVWNTMCNKAKEAIGSRIIQGYAKACEESRDIST